MEYLDQFPLSILQSSSNLGPATQPCWSRLHHVITQMGVHTPDFRGSSCVLPPMNPHLKPCCQSGPALASS